MNDIASCRSRNNVWTSYKKKGMKKRNIKFDKNKQKKDETSMGTTKQKLYIDKKRRNKIQRNLEIKA